MTTGIAKLDTNSSCPDGLRTVSEATAKIMDVLSVADGDGGSQAEQHEGFVTGLTLLAHQRESLAAMVGFNSRTRGPGSVRHRLITSM